MDGNINKRLSLALLFLIYIKKNGPKVNHKKLTSNIIKASLELKEKNIYVDIIFRGSIDDEDNIFSESIDSELWFWMSNKFIDLEAGDDHVLNVSKICTNDNLSLEKLKEKTSIFLEDDKAGEKVEKIIDRYSEVCAL